MERSARLCHYSISSFDFREEERMLGTIVSCTKESHAAKHYWHYYITLSLVKWVGPSVWLGLKPDKNKRYYIYIWHIYTATWVHQVSWIGHSVPSPFADKLWSPDGSFPYFLYGLVIFSLSTCTFTTLVELLYDVIKRSHWLSPYLISHWLLSLLHHSF